MRLVLALIAAIANAAGPWLCCCAVGTMLAGPPPATAAAPIPVESIDDCSHCCLQKALSTDESKPASNPSPSKPCPCQERMETIPAIAPASSDPVMALDFAAEYWQNSAFSTTSLEPIAVAVQASERTFPPPELRQRYHHVLNC